MTETRHGQPRPGHPRGGRAAAAPGEAWRRAAEGERRAAWARDDAGERGAVTAEYAVLLPAVVVMIVAVLLTGAVSLQQVRSQDAAASAARILARGDSASDAREAAARMAGEGAELTYTEEDGWVSVTVEHAGPGPLAAVRISAQAAAPRQHPDEELPA